MSLIDLASSESGQIPYSLISETLQVSNFSLVSIFCRCFSLSPLECISLQIDGRHVESWVINAITIKLIDCKIDQINEIVIVRYKCFFRIFFVHSLFSICN